MDADVGAPRARMCDAVKIPHADFMHSARWLCVKLKPARAIFGTNYAEYESAFDFKPRVCFGNRNDFKGRACFGFGLKLQ